MLNDIKRRLKEKGYSIVTIYDPKQSTVVEILDGNKIIRIYANILDNTIFDIIHSDSFELPNLNKEQK